MSAATKPALAFSRLSTRERALIIIAAALAAIIGAVWLGVLPGIDAARSAENRRARAASDLIDVQALATSASSVRAAALAQPEGDARATAQDIAARHGATLSSFTANDDGFTARLEAPTSAAALDWTSAVSRETGLGARSFSLSRGASGGVSATVFLTRSAP